MTVDATRFKLNSIYGDPEKLWSMPRPSDVPVVDLVNGPLNPNVNAGNSNRVSGRVDDHRTSSSQNEFTQSVFRNLR